MWRRTFLLLAFALWLIFVQRPVSAYLTDTLVYLPLDYLIFLPPPVGGTYLDQIFGTRIKRISDAVNTPSAAGPGNLTAITHEYSNVSPFNHDKSKLILGHQSYFALYDGDGNYIRDLPFEIGKEPRWARPPAAPDVLYYLLGNQLKQYNVVTNAISLVRAFSEYTDINGFGESDISFDGDHFVLGGKTVAGAWEIFVYELSTNTKGPVLNTQGLGGFDNIHITPDNNVLVGWFANGAGRFNGVELYDRSMNFLRQISTIIGHMDETRDINGDEVVISSNEVPVPTCNTTVIKIRLADGQRTCMLLLDTSLALHISAPDNGPGSGGWFFVNTYAPSDPLPLLGIWKTYTNEILQVKLDGSEIRRLAHHRSRPFNDYTWTPRLSVSRDSSRMVYDSNYGLPAILGYPSQYSDVYLIDGLDSGALTRNLSVTKTGNGRVTSIPSGIDCGTDCTEPYPNGTSVTLTALPNHPGEEFLNWDGACAGQPNPCQVMMDSAQAATASFTSRTGGGGGPSGGDGGCFIATAAFGSPLASEVQTLRAARDRFLLTSVPGRLFIAAYYRISPPLARAIAAHEWLKSAVRGALRPVVWWARLGLDSPAAAVAVGIVGLSAVPIILFAPRRARRRDS